MSLWPIPVQGTRSCLRWWTSERKSTRSSRLWARYIDFPDWWTAWQLSDLGVQVTFLQDWGVGCWPKDRLLHGVLASGPTHPPARRVPSASHSSMADPKRSLSQIRTSTATKLARCKKLGHEALERTAWEMDELQQSANIHPGNFRSVYHLAQWPHQRLNKTNSLQRGLWAVQSSLSQGLHRLSWAAEWWHYQPCWARCWSCGHYL